MPNSDHKIIIGEDVLETLSGYRQKKNDPEAGGLLFAKFKFPEVHIVEASPPNDKDKRWKTLFMPNRIIQRHLIKKQFKEGCHFIGEWHTHPISTPSPSALDLNSTKDCFLKSAHELNYFIMVIVGNSFKELELWVSIHNANCYYQLKESS